ncbi:uncharacterized protein LOC112882687 [Panicum hallii]|uniref:uncharacterized protein LOC112882687 n=1 Tax=Panicum hallii TaxID=206008 RepID=UPI000DF4E724|nr:uncharacterized protein LOC112882687 [Panicum hallii]
MGCRDGAAQRRNGSGSQPCGSEASIFSCCGSPSPVAYTLLREMPEDRVQDLQQVRQVLWDVTMLIRWPKQTGQGLTSAWPSLRQEYQMESDLPPRLSTRALCRVLHQQGCAKEGATRFMRSSGTDLHNKETIIGFTSENTSSMKILNSTDMSQGQVIPRPKQE